MWLLDVSTYSLKMCLGRRIWDEFPYAILSHMWEDDEVTFQDIQNLRYARKKKGFGKIEATCKRAQYDGLKYAWIDTCCIDKTSSAELQEAINSMMEFYARSSKCYAYLADVVESDGSECFQSTHWFTRGWTLQELIAPREVIFYDQNWSLIGRRSRYKTSIAERTGINTALLGEGALYEHSDPTRTPADLDPTVRWLGEYSVAQRLSWASERVTSRVEDQAYCLLGMFGINLPLLYGEGKRAFLRLQEEILRVTRDLSIFAWEKPLDAGRHEDFSYEDEAQTLFAPSARAFAGCGSIVFNESPQAWESSAELVISSVGVKLDLPVLTVHVSDHEKADFLAIIHCYDIDDPTTSIGLKLMSRNTMVLGSELVPGRPPLNLLKAIPYSMLDLGVYTAQKRTMRIDVLTAMDEPSWRPVVLMREKEIQVSRWNRSLARKERKKNGGFSGIGTPECIWLRFNTFSAAQDWRMTHSFPQNAWDQTRLTFNFRGKDQHSSGDLYGWTLSDGELCAAGAFVLEKSTFVKLQVVVSFGFVYESASFRAYKHGRLFFRMDASDSEDFIATDLLRDYCRKLVWETIPLERNTWTGNGRFSLHPTTRLGPGAKGVQLVDGTRIHDGCALAIRPYVRHLAGGEIVVFQAYDLSDLTEMDTGPTQRFTVAYNPPIVRPD